MQSSRSAILLVAQHEPTRDLYARALCRNYHVFACGDDHDVLHLLRVQPIRVIVLEPAGATDGGGSPNRTTNESCGTLCLPCPKSAHHCDEC